MKALRLSAGVMLMAPLLAVARGDLAAELRRGRDAVQVCRPQMHEDADEYLDCLRLRVAPRSALGRHTPAERLGAAWFGWVFADLSAANSLPGADAAAQELLLDATRLQRQLHVPDAALCKLVEDGCPRILNRRRERLARKLH